MLLWKTRVMNFITWALNSDSTAALFKSSQQGTVWKFTYPVRNTGSYKIQTKIRCVRGKRMSKVYLCVWVSHVGMHLYTAWTAERHTPKPEHVCSHLSSHDSFHVISMHAVTGISTPRKTTGNLGRVCQPLPSDAPSMPDGRRGWTSEAAPSLPLIVCSPYPMSPTAFSLLCLKQRAWNGCCRMLLRKVGFAVGETKERKGMNSFSQSTPALSFSNHPAIPVLDQAFFKHAITLDIV